MLFWAPTRHTGKCVEADVRRGRRRPSVVVALVATLAVLLAGVVTMTKGGAFNRKWGNKLMRARIAMQALAVMLMFALFLLNRDWGD